MYLTRKINKKWRELIGARRRVKKEGLSQREGIDSSMVGTLPPKSKVSSSGKQRWAKIMSRGKSVENIGSGWNLDKDRSAQQVTSSISAFI